MRRPRILTLSGSITIVHLTLLVVVLKYVVYHERMFSERNLDTLEVVMTILAFVLTSPLGWCYPLLAPMDPYAGLPSAVTAIFFGLNSTLVGYLGASFIRLLGRIESQPADTENADKRSTEHSQ